MSVSEGTGAGVGFPLKSWEPIPCNKKGAIAANGLTSAGAEAEAGRLAVGNLT